MNINHRMMQQQQCINQNLVLDGQEMRRIASRVKNVFHKFFVCGSVVEFQ